MKRNFLKAMPQLRKRKITRAGQNLPPAQVEVDFESNKVCAAIFFLAFTERNSPNPVLAEQLLHGRADLSAETRP